MKPAVALFVAAASLGVSAPVLAVETRTDVQTDHVTAESDGNPHSLGVVVRPLAMALGSLGAEFDAACGEHVVMTVEGAEAGMLATSRTSAYAIDLGVAIYPLGSGFAFHGFYLHPVVEWSRAMGSGPAERLGGGFTLGYAWTWPVGVTVRLGAGLMYAKTLEGQEPAATGIRGVEPRLDADIGWVF